MKTAQKNRETAKQAQKNRESLATCDPLKVTRIVKPLFFRRMETTSQTETLDKALALFSSHCNLPQAALPYWQHRLEMHLHHKLETDSAIALCKVEFVSGLIVKSLTGARDRKQSKGGNPDAGGLAVPSGMNWRETMDCLLAQTTRSKKGKRKQITLSETDKSEIRGTVSLVLSSLGAFNRHLESFDIGECFRKVESVDCLELNRKWKPLENSEPTLANLALPTYDKESDRIRLARLRERLEQVQACIDAAFRADNSRKKAANRSQAMETLKAIVTRKQSGNGKAKNTERLERANFADYLKQGALALQTERLQSAPWQFDLVQALESFQAQTV